VTEKELDTLIREIATRCGWIRYHTFNSRRSPSGFPDLVLVKPPRVVFAELKSGTGKPTPKQVEWLGLLSACPGVETFLWRPDDLDDIARVLSPGYRTPPPPKGEQGVRGSRRSAVDAPAVG